MNINQLEYVPGTWVFYNNPTHQFHGMMFQVSHLIPMKGLDNVRNHKGFGLAYGARSIEAAHSELVKRGTPEAKPFETGSYQVQAKTRTVGASPALGAPYNAHEGHEIVENYAGGKPFKFCRDCKKEVNNGTSETES